MQALLKGLTDTHKYEIDSEKLKKVYNFNSKLDLQYEIINQKLIFSKEKQNLGALNKSEIENHYYSNYKFFREYLSTGFQGEEIKEEIHEIKKLIEYSKKLKESSEKYLNKDKESNSPSRASTGKQSYFKNFIDICKLFAVKKEKENTIKKSQEFTLFTELKIPSDVFSLSTNENFLNHKLLNYKKKIHKSYYKEEFLSNYSNQNKVNKNNTLISNSGLAESFKLSPEIKEKFPIEYIDSMFKNRESELFCNLDSFMSLYKTQKITNKDRDLYENIYGILSKSNYINFMSFLYSKNELFKYIFDEFTSKRQSFDESLDDIKLSGLDCVLTENLFKNSSYFSKSPEVKISIKNKNSYKNFKDSDDLMGNYYFEKIIINFEKIEEKTLEFFLKKSKINKDFNKEKAIIYLNTLCNKIYNSFILITIQEKLKLIQTIEELEKNNNLHQHINKPNEIEEELYNVQFYKIDKKFIADNLSTSLNVNENFINSQIYIVELKNQNSQFYFLRISNENAKRFDIVLSSFDLFKNINERGLMNNNLIIDQNKSLGDNFSNNEGNQKEFSEKSDTRKNSVALLNKKETMAEDKSKKINSYTLNPGVFKQSQTNESNDGLSISDNNNNIFNNFSKPKNEEKKDDDNISFKSIFNKKKSITLQKKEDEKSENNFIDNEIFTFEIDKKLHKVKLSSHGIEYIPKSFIEIEKWNLIEYGNIKNFEIKSENALNYEIIFTLNLKIKLSFNDKEKVNFKGYNENEFKNFRDKLDKYNWIDD